MVLHIDIETYSSVDIRSRGAYKYVESFDFEIMLFAYAIDDQPVKVLDLTGRELPDQIVDLLYDPGVELWAHNAQFERIALRAAGFDIPIERWYCTAALCRNAGLPGSLKDASAALRLGDKSKKDTGMSLIRYFCMPCKPTKTNGGRHRNLPEHDPEKWAEFIEYCRYDVIAEREIHRRLQRIQVPDFERHMYVVDQRINDRGILIDTELASNAQDMARRYKSELGHRLKQLTGISNANSNLQLREWISEQVGRDVPSIAKGELAELRTECVDAHGADSTIVKALDIIADRSGTSTTKFRAMQRLAGADDRARGVLLYYGAERTGRWAGRGFQPQNLPRNYLKDLDGARRLVKGGDYAAFKAEYPSVNDTLKQLIRTTIVAPEGQLLAAVDFSAIEARVLAWLAQEQWRLDVFAGDGRIYETSASRAFGIPLEDITKDSPWRARGKVLELACIAEGQMVLTDEGLVPIEQVSKNHKLWDGVEWVSHEGVIQRGEKEVISWSGLTATEDHIVFTVRGEVPFGEAARNETPLLLTGVRGKPINKAALRMCRATFGPLRDSDHTHNVPTYDILNAGPRNRFTVSGVLVHNCGYQGSVGAVKAMGGEALGLDEAEMKAFVDKWRRASPNIVRFWYKMQELAMSAFHNPGKAFWNRSSKDPAPRIGFYYDSEWLICRLPSGRNLYYYNPGIYTNRFDKPALYYLSTDAMRGVGIHKIGTYGGKLTENITQAVARDMLAHSLLLLDQHENFPVTLHVHDEAVALVPAATAAAHLAEMEQIMSIPPDWAQGFPLTCDGFVSPYYKK